MNREMIKNWRGVNLQGMFVSTTSSIYKPERSPGYFKEELFRITKELGFNFVRIPFSYLIWSSVEDPFTIDEEKFRPMDDAVAYGKKYGLHINIAMHRAPGYCVNFDEKVPKDILWTDEDSLKAFVAQWEFIARRYKDIPSEELSFNVLNEPRAYGLSLSDYTKVCLAMINAVRDISPDRMILIDGLGWGELPPVDLLNTRLENCVYSCRGYCPQGVTHFGHGNQSIYTSESLCWPGGLRHSGFDQNGNPTFWVYDAARLQQLYDAWGALAKVYNVPVFCGEMGCYKETPHDICLAWMEDILKAMHKNQIGYAIWELTGPFGILNSDRKDVEYEDFHGYKLDRKMLDLLMRY